MGSGSILSKPFYKLHHDRGRNHPDKDRQRVRREGVTEKDEKRQRARETASKKEVRVRERG